ncbi:MAG: ShlB/FhaC/HecB family hemolysin secretion/activation protein [Gallionellaceae bacterium]|jgi:hemolysin activation/secretion protein
MKQKIHRWIFSVSMLSSFAQAAPDGAMLRQQIEQSLPPLMPQAAPVLPSPPPAPMRPTEGNITVLEFRFAGNTLINTDVLLPVVAAWLNRPLDFNQLQQATAAVAQVYRDAGWVVRVYLPIQEIINGIITIQIIEATYGGVIFEGEPLKRNSPKRLRRMLEAQQPVGQPLKAKTLDRTLLILSDLPGVSVLGSLHEGKQQGESEVILKVADKALLTGDAGVDNTGSRSTGPNRLTANFSLNSPLRFADQAMLNLMHTEGSNYARLGYSIPLGFEGWRAGVNASAMQYHLVAPEMLALNGLGESYTQGLEVTYPYYRSRLANVNFSAAYDHKAFDNSSAGATTTRYQLNTVLAGINANLTDNILGGGTSSGSLSLITGNVDLAGSPNQAADALTTKTAGNFAKLRYSASRQQTLINQLGLNANFSGQFAGKNLDSGERFSLGGSSGVRGYPSGEVSGSEGMMLNIDLRWPIASGFTLSGFYDWGAVTVNRNNDFVGKTLQNQLSLQSVGASVAWQGQYGLNAKFVWAHRLDDNPNATLSGNDQDGTKILNRLWLNAGISF